jgi:hypothetical protein
VWSTAQPGRKIAIIDRCQDARFTVDSIDEDDEHDKRLSDAGLEWARLCGDGRIQRHRLTLALREELRPDGIAVTLFSSGGTFSTTAANWSEASVTAAMTAYRHENRPVVQPMSAELVGEAIVRCLEAPAGVCYEFVEFRPFSTATAPHRQS